MNRLAFNQTARVSSRSWQSLLGAAVAAALLSACGGNTTAPPEQKGADVETRIPTTGKITAIDNQPITTVTTAPIVDTNGLALLKDKNSILSKRSVYFDYDSYVIRDEFKTLVESHAAFLAKHPAYKMLIQGNADERGSREYNLALGQKRADALKRALSIMGGREDQLEAVSLGKEKPRNAGHDEAAWAENRRDDMLYSGEF